MKCRKIAAKLAENHFSEFSQIIQQTHLHVSGFGKKSLRSFDSSTSKTNAYASLNKLSARIETAFGRATKSQIE